MKKLSILLVLVLIFSLALTDLVMALATDPGDVPGDDPGDEPGDEKPPKGNNGVGNGEDPQPPGEPDINDGPGTKPGHPGKKDK